MVTRLWRSAIKCLPSGHNVDDGQWICTNYHIQRKPYLVSACIASSSDKVSISFLLGAQAFACVVPLQDSALAPSTEYEHWALVLIIYASRGTLSIPVIALCAFGCFHPPNTFNFSCYLSETRCCYDTHCL